MEDDGRPTTAIDGNELRGLVAQARDGRAALKAQLAAAAATGARGTEAIAPIVVILDRPAKVVDDNVAVKGRVPAILNPEKFRAIAPAAEVVASLDAAIAAHVAATGTLPIPTATTPMTDAMFAPPSTQPAAAPVEQARITGLEVLQLEAEPSRRVPRISPIVRHATGVSVPAPRPRIDVYVLAALVFVLSVVLWIRFA